MNLPEKKSEISLIIDSRIYGYLFAPIITGLKKSGARIFIYTPKRIRDDIRNDIGVDDQVEFLDLDSIRKRYRWRWYLHRVAMDIFVRDDFSFQMYKKNYEVTKRLPLVRRLLVKSSRLLPKIPNKSINFFLENLSGIGMSNPFRTKVVIAGSLNASAELLCAKDQVVVTVMESWDHAVKHPNGYTSELVFTWNEDLKKDWQRVHNDQNVHTFYPLKLRYARDIVTSWPKLAKQNSRPFFVYCVSSTQRFCMKILVDLEKKLMRDLARAAEMADWNMFIKPRPNGEDCEFSDIVKEFPNVRVGSVVDQQVNQAADYSLSDEYNKKRFSEIEGAEFVVNAFTTFGLDAAAAQIPVLQIDIRNANGYEESGLIYENYHLKTYLLPHESVLRINGDLVTFFSAYLKMPNHFPEQYSTKLVNWLFGPRSQSEAIEILVNKVLHLTADKVKNINH
jgi:hypothetical protein